jgi:guanyl-specific ribonuclease Sa
MKSLWFVLIFLLIFHVTGVPTFAREPQKTKLSEVTLADLPKEGRDTLAVIKQGGPFPYRRDGVVFGNFERCYLIGARLSRIMFYAGPAQRRAPNHSRSRRRVLLYRRPLPNLHHIRE